MQTVRVSVYSAHHLHSAAPPGGSEPSSKRRHTLPPSKNDIQFFRVDLRGGGVCHLY